jgi:methylmalonyl-CoA/ethylmalonyl-CoA epimerase
VPCGGAVPAPPPDLKLSQFALVVKELASVSAFWRKLGWPEMVFTHPAIRDRRYRDAAGTFDQELGWHRHGTVTYEWIRSVRGPTVYDDFLKTHGEGVHHLGFDVPDFDAALARWARQGMKEAQSGAWGDPGKPGSGRYAYVDSEPAGGVFVELLSNVK